MLDKYLLNKLAVYADLLEECWQTEELSVEGCEYDTVGSEAINY